jgi:hypothetical protein
MDVVWCRNLLTRPFCRKSSEHAVQCVYTSRRFIPTTSYCFVSLLTIIVTIIIVMVIINQFNDCAGRNEDVSLPSNREFMPWRRIGNVRIVRPDSSLSATRALPYKGRGYIPRLGPDVDSSLNGKRKTEARVSWPIYKKKKKFWPLTIARSSWIRALKFVRRCTRSLWAVQ